MFPVFGYCSGKCLSISRSGLAPTFLYPTVLVQLQKNVLLKSLQLISCETANETGLTDLVFSRHKMSCRYKYLKTIQQASCTILPLCVGSCRESIHTTKCQLPPNNHKCNLGFDGQSISGLLIIKGRVFMRVITIYEKRN